MALHPAPVAEEARAKAHRLRLAPNRVYACRICREAVRVTSSRYLPEECPGCSATTWDVDGSCGNWGHCDAVRRPGIHRRAHCHACGYSIWAPVGSSRAHTLMA